MSLPSTVSPMLKRWFSGLGIPVVAMGTNGSDAEMAVRPEQDPGDCAHEAVLHSKLRWLPPVLPTRAGGNVRDEARTFAGARDVHARKIASAHESLRALQSQLEKGRPTLWLYLPRWRCTAAHWRISDPEPNASAN